ncbi:glycosyltransferase [Shewanella violacea]|uniref:Glycosyl transferase n=1 Tax=Shewanella violacea (strain JCM 10179 / CIP 106290 / LMG 19151 / DSS12) TaxID=637905 RepID=D4ZDF2_SHEVD|nr:glycosyltransferase [Shewanella violacea]BAJ00074.1 hypothetical protein SVI_0103 [Shewanella violacea DSS12]
MKKAIFTLAIGDNPMYRAAIESFRIYADKVGADLIVSEELHYQVDIKNPKYDANPAWSEKLYIGELLKKYDRVLYLDADFIITPEAENVFDTLDDLNSIYMFNEGRYRDRTPVIKEACDLLGDVPNWDSVSNLPVYFNMGMLLISKECPLFEHLSVEKLQSVCNKIKFYEQTLTNYMIQKHKISYKCVESKFNRMDLLGLDNYRQADFIHYAGRGFRDKCPLREVRYIADYCEMFHDQVSESQRKQLKKDAWNLYIAKLQRKTKLPYSLLNTVVTPLIGKKWL